MRILVGIALVVVYMRIGCLRAQSSTDRLTEAVLAFENCQDQIHQSLDAAKRSRVRPTRAAAHQSR
jgi:hypothetical protein